MWEMSAQDLSPGLAVSQISLKGIITLVTKMKELCKIFLNYETSSSCYISGQNWNYGSRIKLAKPLDEGGRGEACSFGPLKGESAAGFTRGLGPPSGTALFSKLLKKGEKSC